MSNRGALRACGLRAHRAVGRGLRQRRSGPAPADSGMRARRHPAPLPPSPTTTAGGRGHRQRPQRSPRRDRRGTLRHDASPAAVDQTLNAVPARRTARENDPLYAEYRVAVFQPDCRPRSAGSFRRRDERPALLPCRAASCSLWPQRTLVSGPLRGNSRACLSFRAGARNSSRPCPRLSFAPASGSPVGWWLDAHFAQARLRLARPL